MKKKLFVFVVLAMLLVACKPAVKGGDTSNSETPLELTAANLAGKWVLDSDSTKWYEFKADGTYSSDKETQKGFTVDTLNKKITMHVTNFWGEDSTMTKDIVLYKTHFIFNLKKYIKN